ncbi:hypothetical protein [Endozoicomonas sp.]|uniref:hypothetical protein n=1 Tax=Endozoicomonas sp. TaxID=1892382 RepID=UPI0028875E40|nr:hypothetical protein [Endozoicomonas sp.]
MVNVATGPSERLYIVTLADNIAYSDDADLNETMGGVCGICNSVAFGKAVECVHGGCGKFICILCYNSDINKQQQIIGRKVAIEITQPKDQREAVDKTLKCASCRNVISGQLEKDVRRRTATSPLCMSETRVNCMACNESVMGKNIDQHFEAKHPGTTGIMSVPEHIKKIICHQNQKIHDTPIAGTCKKITGTGVVTGTQPVNAQPRAATASLMLELIQRIPKMKVQDVNLALNKDTIEGKTNIVYQDDLNTTISNEDLALKLSGLMTSPGAAEIIMGCFKNHMTPEDKPLLISYFYPKLISCLDKDERLISRLNQVEPMEVPGGSAPHKKYDTTYMTESISTFFDRKFRQQREGMIKVENFISNCTETQLGQILARMGAAYPQYRNLSMAEMQIYLFKQFSRGIITLNSLIGIVESMQDNNALLLEILKADIDPTQNDLHLIPKEVQEKLAFEPDKDLANSMKSRMYKSLITTFVDKYKDTFQFYILVRALCQHLSQAEQAESSIFAVNNYIMRGGGLKQFVTYLVDTGFFSKSVIKLTSAFLDGK